MSPRAAQDPSAAREEQLAPFVAQILDVIGQEYPNLIRRLLMDDSMTGLPRQLTPSFFGAFDWHSAVHGHWALARALRLCPDADFRSSAERALAVALSTENIVAEARFVAEQPHFEIPYGAAWLLMLAGEIDGLAIDPARAWAAALRPLEELFVARLREWLAALAFPVRSGEHSQSAFAMGFLLDYAGARRNTVLGDRVRKRARELYERDRSAPLAYEPSGHDFLSPALAEADLMARVLPAAEYAGWLGSFLEIPVAGDAAAAWFPPCECRDPTDGKQVHLVGLNLSRAWMLDGIAAALPPGDARARTLVSAAARHKERSLPFALTPHYAGRHWLGSFAIYVITGRLRLG